MTIREYLCCCFKTSGRKTSNVEVEATTQVEEDKRASQIMLEPTSVQLDTQETEKVAIKAPESSESSNEGGAITAHDNANTIAAVSPREDPAERVALDEESAIASEEVVHNPERADNLGDSELLSEPSAALNPVAEKGRDDDAAVRIALTTSDEKNSAPLTIDPLDTRALDNEAPDAHPKAYNMEEKVDSPQSAANESGKVSSTDAINEVESNGSVVGVDPDDATAGQSKIALNVSRSAPDRGDNQEAESDVTVEEPPAAEDLTATEEVLTAQEPVEVENVGAVEGVSTDGHVAASAPGNEVSQESPESFSQNPLAVEALKMAKNGTETESSGDDSVEILAQQFADDLIETKTIQVLRSRMSPTNVPSKAFFHVLGGELDVLSSGPLYAELLEVLFNAIEASSAKSLDDLKEADINRAKALASRIAVEAFIAAEAKYTEEPQ